MTIEELYQAAKVKVRKTMADPLDQDIQRIVDAGAADLKRIGVHETWLESPSDPLIVEAVLSYVRANYSIDVTQYPILSGIYSDFVTKIKGSLKYFETMDPTKNFDSDEISSIPNEELEGVPN